MAPTAAMLILGGHGQLSSWHTYHHHPAHGSQVVAPFMKLMMSILNPATHFVSHHHQDAGDTNTASFRNPNPKPPAALNVEDRIFEALEMSNW